MSKGAYAVHKILVERLLDYLRSQYLGKSPVLLEALERKMQKEGGLYREAYIESSQAYKVAKKGIDGSSLPEHQKKFFAELCAAGLGVYKTPYVHQIRALENAYEGKDVFVATGTGSGKTECFMWPMLSKLYEEAHARGDSWKQRGVRAIVLYPMNALVSDQLSRLRRLVGDVEGRFVAAFREGAGAAARRPQFGMYTGRTPYPGPTPSDDADKKLAKTLKTLMPDGAGGEKTFEALLKQGKIPAKRDLRGFIEKLGRHDHTPDAEDAELVTRFEMQRCCPDILITNYSMLEYMLMRPREAVIWEDTKKWLGESAENKLLFVIDEAHMYRGASGGEVALLIRRLFRKLGIARDRVQFILTTASMPYRSDEDKESVNRFFVDLTSAAKDAKPLFLQGEREPMPEGAAKEIPEDAYAEFGLDGFDSGEDSKLAALNSFWAKADVAAPRFSSMVEAEGWLYDHLQDYAQFRELFKECRGEAKSLTELRESVFPGIPEEEGMSRVSVLLAIAPIGRNDKGAVLFPARMHMLFRGLQGVFACSNPECPNHVHNGVELGDVSIFDGHDTCPECGSAVYEVYNDRRCGALFYKGYVRLDGSGKIPSGPVYLWRTPGDNKDAGVKSIDLYIPPDDFPSVEFRTKHKDVKVCYLEVRSGFLFFNDDSMDGRPGYRRLYYNAAALKKKSKKEDIEFSKCPHCNRMLTAKAISPFKTKGNQAFFNLIATQFNIQPPVAGKDACPDLMPNQGRKVLLFSDSRQRAAKLARDMAEASDDTASRQLMLMAIREMDKFPDLSFNDIYGFFVCEAAKQHAYLFSNLDGQNFKDTCRKELKNMAIRNRIGRIRPPHIQLSNASGQALCEILKLYCSPYNTLTDVGASWLEPTEDALCMALGKLDELKYEVDPDFFLAVFDSWLFNKIYPNVALGEFEADDIRKTIRDLHTRFGLDENWDFDSDVREWAGWGSGESGNRVAKDWRDVFDEVFMMPQGEMTFLRADTVRPVSGIGKQWKVCEACGGFSPRDLNGLCPRCGGRMRDAEAGDMSTNDFWLAPIRGALSGAVQVRVIDTEEHTAQLSHKDQRDDMWSMTEKYELLFQDLLDEGETPVDILSSTTTMEVGIDIGSLVAVGLRNVPPMRENYQQRAGRAGRRGASLSTILTFCEDGPHDAMYFKAPRDMFSGLPRQPWIDVRNEKLVGRHLAVMILEEYLLESEGKGLDEFEALQFVEEKLSDFGDYLEGVDFSEFQSTVPVNFDMEEMEAGLKKKLRDDLNAMAAKVIAHRELYEPHKEGEPGKAILDALYEEAVIPTYSFPKNVVSMYIQSGDGKLKFDVQRGLDVALSEYAPGRSIVVNKDTYQIGGIYSFGSDRGPGKRNKPAESFFADANYLKQIQVCDRCEWFGIVTNENDKVAKCPFCGGSVSDSTRSLLKPWGFAPRDGKSISLAELEEEYSSAQIPLYSTVPNDSEDVQEVEGYAKIRYDVRDSQQIIVINKGPKDEGFQVCDLCGAAMPGKEPDALNSVGRPYIPSWGHLYRCGHHPRPVNLGFDFKTDMLVVEIPLDAARMDVNRKGLWISRAAQTLSEALRLEICRKLDIEFTELVAGYRVRNTQIGCFLDVYVYDNLSSGAGYSAAVAKHLASIMDGVHDRLSGCDCERACYKCLKHYRNQMVHGKLDRHAALQLVEWCKTGEIVNALPLREQYALVKPFEEMLGYRYVSVKKTPGGLILEQAGKTVSLEVYPGILAPRPIGDVVHISDVRMRYDKPTALACLLSPFDPASLAAVEKANAAIEDGVVESIEKEGYDGHGLVVGGKYWLRGESAHRVYDGGNFSAEDVEFQEKE